MFESAEFKTAQSKIDDIAMSFLRGSVNDSHDARMRLLAALKASTSHLSDRERKKLRSYQPNIVIGFSGEARLNYSSWIVEALGR